ncbi:GTP pyrophosphokinase [Deinococcus cavernae]|nr:GTP pyrophosphokinase family protein [Deinococcus cavernae]
MMRVFMQSLVAEYESRQAEFEALRRAAIVHVQRLLDEAGLNIHHVTSRVKKPASLADKLRRKPGRHHALDDVTDLVGVRVITYFESDVNVVSKLVEGAYQVDWNNSVDKSKMRDPDRFGYMGVHYVVRPLEGTPEFRGLHLRAFPLEIQIRSILQHAWAEIEHDLGYKNPDAVPREVRRRFYRLAGLLEMADEEFMTVARLSRDYGATLPQRVAEEPDSVFIDAQSMKFLLDTGTVAELDRRIANALNVTLLVGWPDPERPQRLASLLQYVGVHSVGQLDRELQRHADDIERFAVALLPRVRQVWMPAGGARPGTSLTHYALLRANEHPGLDVAEVVHLLDLSGVGSEQTLRQGVTEVLRDLRLQDEGSTVRQLD